MLKLPTATLLALLASACATPLEPTPVVSVVAPVEVIKPRPAPPLVYAWLTCLGGAEVTCISGVEHDFVYLPSKAIVAMDLDWGDAENSVVSSNIAHHNYSYAGTYLLVAKLRYVVEGVEFQTSVVLTIKVVL